MIRFAPPLLAAPVWSLCLRSVDFLCSGDDAMEGGKTALQYARDASLLAPPPSRRKVWRDLLPRRAPSLRRGAFSREELSHG